MGELLKGRLTKGLTMFYVINDHEAVMCDWLFSPVKRALKKDETRVFLDVEPYTEKGEPSKRCKPFRIVVFNAPDYPEIWVYGWDKNAYYCSRELGRYFEGNGIPVYFHRVEKVEDFLF